MKGLLTAFIAILAALQPAGAAKDLSLKTIVIDAGHGGKDPGAVSPEGKHYEKTFTLKIAGKLKERINKSYPEVKVLMTRSEDCAVTLNRRAEIANKAGADLFISIHINSSTDRSANGYSVHVLGKSHKANTDIFRMNLDMVKRENSVITLDDDFNPETAGFDPRNPESYIFMTMMQSAYLEQSIQFAQDIMNQLSSGPIVKNRGVSQDPFYVLWKTSMPSVLVELGFISNKNDLAALLSEEKTGQIADALFRAFEQYKKDYDASMSISAVHPEKSGPKAVVTSAESKEKQTVYGVQIFTIGKKVPEGDPALMGYKPLIISAGTKYRHIIGMSPERSETQKVKDAVSKKYPDAFIVKLEVDR